MSNQTSSKKGFVETPVVDSSIKEVDSSKPENLIPEIQAKELPSRFLGYPVGAEIKYRPYTYGEVKKLSQSALSYQDKAELVLSGITTNFPKDNITTWDFLYLALLRQLQTVGPEKVVVQYTCLRGHANKKIIESMKIEYTDLDSVVEKLPAVATIGGKRCEFNLLTIQDYLDLRAKSLDADLIAVLSKQCKNMNYDQAYELLSNGSQKDGEVLEYIDQILFHGVKPVTYECEHETTEGSGKCGIETQVRLDGEEAVLLPFRAPGHSVRHRVQFGG